MSSRTPPLANTAWQSLLGAHAAVMRQLAASAAWGDLPMREYDVLYTLSTCEVPVSQSELERHVLLSQPAISRLVDRLVARDLVRRSADPADGRRVLLSLTDSGRALQRRTGAQHARDVAREVGSRLSRDEMAQLTQLGRKLAGDRAPSRVSASAQLVSPHEGKL